MTASPDNSIKITEEYIQFVSGLRIKQFTDRYSTDKARFEFEFQQPVHAGGSEVYIPADTRVSEAQLEKLEHFNVHNEHYRIKHSPEVVKFYILHLRQNFADLLHASREEFLMTLYEGVSGNAIGGIITHALFDPQKPNAYQLTLWLLKIYEQDKGFFIHIARCGLYSLGIAFSSYARKSFLHRNAFQMSLLSDALLHDPDDRKISLYNRTSAFQREYSKNIANSAQSLDLSEEIVYALRNHLDQKIGPDEEQSATSESSSLFDTINNEKSPSDADQVSQSNAIQDALLAIMRVTRFLTDVERGSIDPEVRFREMIAGLSYLTEKEILPASCTRPVLDRSKQHIEIIVKMKHIAQVEASCLKKDKMAAWAYPKPNATQVICLRQYEDCPNLLRGRPVNVVGMGDGLLSRFQVPGEYQKCKLAENLENQT